MSATQSPDGPVFHQTHRLSITEVGTKSGHEISRSCVYQSPTEVSNLLYCHIA